MSEKAENNKATSKLRNAPSSSKKDEMKFIVRKHYLQKVSAATSKHDTKHHKVHQSCQQTFKNAATSANKSCQKNADQSEIQVTTAT